VTAILAPALAFAAAALGGAGLALLLPIERPRPPGDAQLLRLMAGAGGRVQGWAAVPAPGELPARVAAAGLPGGLGPRDVMAAKLAAAVAAGAAGLLLAGVAPGRLGVLIATVAPAAGFLAPDAWLARRAAERARRVTRDLPAMLDLLRVTVAAGGSLAAALARVGERATGPLAAEWRAVGSQVRVGVPLESALAGLAERLPQPEVAALVAALARARRHGAPLSETLAAQARDARLALGRRAREEAARAGPKIQLVVALLLVPSVLLLVAAALAAALLDSGGAVLPA
jgi:tight adherence protein C